jgi:hypothetical protein
MDWDTIVLDSHEVRHDMFDSMWPSTKSLGGDKWRNLEGDGGSSGWWKRGETLARPI